MQKIFRKLRFFEKALLIGVVFFALIFLLTKLKFDILATSPTDPLGFWIQETDLPYSLASHVGFISNNHAYVISGAGDSLHSDVLSANINQDSTLSSWSSVSNLPQTLIWHSLAQNGNTFYILGGVNPGGLLNSVNTVYAASVNSDGSLTNWATLMPLPEGLDLGGALVWNNKLYYLGGEMRNNRISGSPILKRTIYVSTINPDGTIGSWDIAGYLPEALYSAAVFVNDGKIVIAGGVNTIGVGGLRISSSVRYSYINPDGSIGRWFELTSLPQAIQRPGFTISNGFYVIAGGTNSSTFSPTLNSVYISPIGGDGLPGEWTLSSNVLPTSECCSALLSNSNYLYLVGGYSTQTGYLNKVFKSNFEFQAPAPTPTPSPTPSSSPIAPSASDWPMFKKISTHTGYNQVETSLVPPLFLKWKFDAGGAIYGSPVVVGNTIYFASDTGGTYAVDLITGNLKWKFNSGARGVAVAYGLVYTTTSLGDSGIVYALDAETGSVRWNRNQPWGINIPTIDGGVLYFGGPGWSASALDAFTGDLLWRVELKDGTVSAPTVSNGKVFITTATSDGSIYALDSLTGAILWRSNLGGLMLGSPAVDQNNVYVNDGSGFLHSLNTDTGIENWRFQSNDDVITSSPAVANGIVYVQTKAGRIYAVNQNNGLQVWTFKTSGVAEMDTSSASVANGVVYIGATDSNVYALDVSNGNVLWQFSTGGKIIFSSPAIKDAMVLIGSTDGNLYAFGQMPPISQLTITKHVVNDNGGTNIASDFTINVSGNNVSTSSFPGSEQGTTITLSSGSYNVTESGPASYSSTFSADCSGTIDVGQTKTCTITNDDLPAHLTVIKHVINNSGGINTASDFTINVTGTNVSRPSFPGDESGITVILNSSSYSVAETGPTGYVSSFSANCQGTIANGETKTCTITNDDIPQLSGLSPADVWVGLANSDDVSIRFDLRAEVYKNGNLVGSGSLDSVPGGSSGFNNAKLDSIPLAITTPVAFNPGDTLSITVLVRNACSGSGKNSGRARLWYNDSVANTHFDATIAGATNNYYFLTGFSLSTSPGPGPKATIDVQAGSKCSPYQPFGTWSITP